MGVTEAILKLVRTIPGAREALMMTIHRGEGEEVAKGEARHWGCVARLLRCRYGGGLGARSC